ncbi:hypothetical protein CRUP_023388 [Coryphaenoides rupestris]|nr:hypothetical protein CRUP_023388 [Coryphaenoides rupestris]
MRITAEPPRTMQGTGAGSAGSAGSGNFLLVPIPECPVLVVPNQNVKLVVLGASNVGKTVFVA